MPFPRELQARPENNVPRMAQLNIAHARKAHATQSVRSASISQRSLRSSQLNPTKLSSRTVSYSVERKQAQPWDDTISNLRRYKLNPSMELLRRMNRISKHKENAAASLQERLKEMERDVRPFLAKKAQQHPTSAFASRVSTGRQPHPKTKSTSDLGSKNIDLAVRKATSLRDLASCLAELDGLPSEDSFSDQQDFSWGDVQEVEDDISRLQTVLTRLGHGNANVDGQHTRPTLTRTASPMPATKQAFRPGQRSPAKITGEQDRVAMVATPQRRNPHYRNNASPARYDPYPTHVRQASPARDIRQTRPASPARDIPRQARQASPARDIRQVRGSSPAVRDLKPPRQIRTPVVKAQRGTKETMGSPPAMSWSPSSDGFRDEYTDKNNNEHRAPTPSFGLTFDDCTDSERRSVSQEHVGSSLTIPLPTFRPYNDYPNEPDALSHRSGPMLDKNTRYSDRDHGKTLSDQENRFSPTLSIRQASVFSPTDKHADKSAPTRTNRIRADANPAREGSLRYDETFRGPLSDLINRQVDDVRRIFG